MSISVNLATMTLTKIICLAVGNVSVLESPVNVRVLARSCTGM